MWHGRGVRAVVAITGRTPAPATAQCSAPMGDTRRDKPSPQEYARYEDERTQGAVCSAVQSRP